MGTVADDDVVQDLDAEEVARVKSRGVTFRSEPVEMEPITTAIFEDGCGNLINLVQPAG